MKNSVEKISEKYDKNNEKKTPNKEQLITTTDPLLLKTKELTFFRFIKSSFLSVILLYAYILAQIKKQLKITNIKLTDIELNNK